MAYDAESIRYPRITRRIEAVLIDAAIFLALFFGSMNLLAPSEIHGGIKAAIIVIPLLLFEPAFVSFTGASIGHHLRGMRVIAARDGRNLNLVVALLRLIAKAILGFPSLIFVMTSKRHQAIHDMAARSLVILKDPAAVGAGESLAERRVEEAGFIYPSKVRRIVFIVLYCFAVLTIFIEARILILPDECVMHGRCSPNEKQLASLTHIVLWFFIALSIVAGWKGRLWGARRKPAAS